MKRRSGIVFLVVGIILAIAVAIGVYVLVQNAMKTSRVETVRAVKVAVHVPARTTIAAPALELVTVPADLKPANAVSSIEAAAGKMALADLYPGDWVLSERLADAAGEDWLAFSLEDGKVLVTFPGSDIVGIGAIKIGDAVDLLVTVDTAKELGTLPTTGSTANLPAGGVTQILIQNMKVQSIGPVVADTLQKTQRASDATSNLLTFAVSREDALTLKQVKDHPEAKKEVVLRAAGDEQIYSVDATDMKKLIERYNIQVP